MKKKIFGICAMILCIVCIGCLTACNGGGGGGDDGGGGNNGGGTTTNAADFSYVSTDSGTMITAYKGSDKIVNLPTKATDGTTVVGILYVFSNSESEIKAPFENSSVEEIQIPASITFLGNSDEQKDGNAIRNVFYRAKSLKKITVAQDNSAYTSRDGALYDKNMSTLIACPAQIDTLAVPEGVTKIAPAAFKCDYSLGNGVETAYNSNFEKFGTFSSNFTSVSLPSTLKSFSFEGCRKLASVDLSRSAVTSLDIGAFRQCFALKSVMLPDSLETIGTGAFQNSGIQSITIPQNARAIDVTSNQDGSGVTKSLATDVFSFCRELTKVIGPAQVLFGEKSSDAYSAVQSGTNQFLGCHSLREITVNGANPGSGGTAFAVTDLKYDTGWCNETDAANGTFRALQKITYSNGCFDRLDSSKFSEFTTKYPNVSIV